MKYSQLAALIGVATVSGLKLEKNQRSLFDTSLVMIEAGIPVPTSAPVKPAATKPSSASSTAAPAKPTHAAW